MFSLQSVLQIGAAVLRVTIADGIPISKDPRNLHDVLNPLNWTVMGSDQIVVDVVRTVSGNPHDYDLVLEIPIDTGSWRVTALDIQNVAGASLFGQVLTFDAADVQDYFTNPRDQQSGEDLVKQSLMALDGPGWRAMTAALGRGDEIVREIANAAFYQMFMPTAGGTYLERLTSSVGVDRPADVGFSDDELRNLSMALNANKVVGVALEAILEAYYGLDATRIFAQSATAQPYAIDVGDELRFAVDGQDILITFDSAASFTTIGAASAREVSAAINRGLVIAGVRAYAIPFTDPETGLVYVRIYSGIPGLRGRMQFFGGQAWDVFRFPTNITTTQAVSTQWSLTPATPNNGIPTGHVRLQWTGGPTPNLQNVFAGDRVNIFGSPFQATNRGVYEITDTTVNWVDYIVDPNQQITTQATVIQVDARDVFFVRPSLIAPDPHLFAAVVRPAPESAEILLPATTSAVTRSLKTAWYVNGEQAIGVTAGSRAQGSSTVALTTALPHGLTEGRRFRLDSVIIDYDATLPDLVEAAPGMDPIYYTDFALKMTDGRILTFTQDQNYQIYDPVTDTYSVAASTGFAGVADKASADLMTDGRVFVVRAQEARIYDPEQDVWVGAAIPPYKKYYGQVVKLRNGHMMAIGKDNGGTNALRSDDYDPATNTWGNPLLLTASGYYGQGAAVSPDGRVLVVGGEDPHAETWLYNADENVWRRCQDVPTPLFSASIIAVPRGPGGEMWAAGATATISSIFVFNMSTQTWSARPTIHSYAWGALTLRNTEVFFLNSGLDEGHDWEIHDFSVPQVASRRLIPNTFDNSGYQPFIVALDDGTIMSIGQGGEPAFRFQLYAPVRQLSGGRLAGEFVVSSVLSPTQLEFLTPDIPEATVITSALLTPILAERGTLASGYILDTKNGVAIADAQTALTVNAPRGLTSSIFNVGSTAGFADAPGYVVLNFGRSTQSVALRYLGIASATQLRMAAGQILSTDYAPGSTVTLLIGTGPYAPSNAGGLGVTYVTSSSVGRIEAVKDIEFAQGAGLRIIQNVLYPSDRGLGNEGFPTSGNQKISDAVEVWGGDAVDAELEEARQ